MDDRGHNRHGPKEGGCCAPFPGGGSCRSSSNTMGRGLLPYQVASSSMQPFGHNRHGSCIFNFISSIACTKYLCACAYGMILRIAVRIQTLEWERCSHWYKVKDVYGNAVSTQKNIYGNPPLHPLTIGTIPHEHNKLPVCKGWQQNAIISFPEQCGQEEASWHQHKMHIATFRTVKCAYKHIN